MIRSSAKPLTRFAVLQSSKGYFRRNSDSRLGSSSALLTCRHVTGRTNGKASAGRGECVIPSAHAGWQ
jgi:hypothetical protein